MTEKLYHQDAYLQEFEAIVTQLSEDRIALDRTAFYPGGGGQPNDLGRMVRVLQRWDLAPEQYFVYAWRYGDDAVCKLGVSTLRSFYARIKAAKTVTYQDIELLGIEVFGTEAEARTAYQQRLKMFARVADRRAWVHFDAVVRQWLSTECVSNPPTLDAFKDAFQNDPARREKEREYQRRSSQKRTTRKRTAAKPGKKRTEKDRAYEREYARKRRENDPAYKEKQKERQKVWRTKNPGYDRNRYAD